MSYYAAPSDLVGYYDRELVGQLATDDHVPLSVPDILTHENVVKALTAASGEVDVNLLTGGRYQATDLSGLAGSAAEHLKRITCAVAMAILVQRRLTQVNYELAKTLMDASREYLKALAAGKNVFGLQPEIDAGTPKFAEAIGPSNVHLNLNPRRMYRHFPE